MDAICWDADFARSISTSSVRLPMGCGTVAHFMSGIPPSLAIVCIGRVKASVPIMTAGMPHFSNSTLLSRPLELHAPQSPLARMMASHRSMSFHSSRRMSLLAL